MQATVNLVYHLSFMVLTRNFIIVGCINSRKSIRLPLNLPASISNGVLRTALVYIPELPAEIMCSKLCFDETIINFKFTSNQYKIYKYMYTLEIDILCS